ncbi:MAG: hypothetical protein AAFZ07_02940 [Actinomycetota bacterium]
MSTFRCVIQAGSNADTRADELERRLREHDAKHYPAEEVEVTWVPIPPGHMFTEGEQSTSSVVSCFVDHVTTLDLRETYLRGVCDIWTEVTDCTDHEVVVTITETATATQE